MPGKKANLEYICGIIPFGQNDPMTRKTKR
jgi:hypothetical protein